MGARLTQSLLLAATLALATPADAGHGSGHTHHARSHAARAAFQRYHPCPATGRPSGACPGFVVDHIVPLKRGGADTPGNMQWQTTQAAREKDRWE